MIENGFNTFSIFHIILHGFSGGVYMGMSLRNAPSFCVYCYIIMRFRPKKCGFYTEKCRFPLAFAPKLCYVQHGGFYALGETDKQAATTALLALDAVKIAVYSRAFGGALPQSDALTDFIVNWEVEAYRAGKAE